MPLSFCATHLSHPAIDFCDRLRELKAPALVRGGLQLTCELGARQTKRLEQPHLLGVARLAAAPRGALAFELLHPLLNSRIRVNQTLAGVTHVVIIRSAP